MASIWPLQRPKMGGVNFVCKHTLGCHFKRLLVDLIWSTLVQGGMPPNFIVPPHVLLNAFEQFYRILLWIKVDVLVFEASPEAFNKGIVGGSSFAVHAQPNALANNILRKNFTRKLRPLVGVENGWFAILRNGLFNHLFTPISLHSIGQRPAQNLAAEQVYDGHQIHKAFGHWGYK